MVGRSSDTLNAEQRSPATHRTPKTASPNGAHPHCSKLSLRQRGPASADWIGLLGGVAVEMEERRIGLAGRRLERNMSRK